MPKINVLDKQIAELIAAGEVVERPASVIKELVENSIDAGATVITVEIKNGGIIYMRVTDNGCGISREDVPLAFLRHATSKVKEAQDLDDIATLGFRGEALASICAVSKVDMLTCSAEEKSGTHYVIEAGRCVQCAEAGCPRGTTIVVRDLFYNTPARMKFLKKDVTEGTAVSGILDKIALSHPEICLRFIRDGKEILHTPGDGKMKSAIFAVYGKEIMEGMLPVDYQYQNIAVTGFIGRPSEARPTRNLQVFFLNGRYVKSKTAVAALEEAYKGCIMVGKFPICVLHLQIDCRDVDVNVHPAKIEVRFADERPIFDGVLCAVKSALMQHDRNLLQQQELPRHSAPVLPPLPQHGKQLQINLPVSVPKTEASAVKAVPPTSIDPRSFLEKLIEDVPSEQIEAASENAGAMRAPSVGEPTAPEEMNADEREKKIRMRESELSHQPTTFYHSVLQSQEKQEPASAEEAEIMRQPSIVENNGRCPLIYIGELFHTYILLQGDKELLLVDKHAAHERILYEKLKSQNRKEYQQMLLEPITVTLDKKEYAAVMEQLILLEQAGFDVEDFGEGTLLVRGAPLYLENQDITSTVVEIAGYLTEHKNDITTRHLEWLYHNIACRAAMKAGDCNDKEEILRLIERLYDDISIRYCPHGRPIFSAFSRYEIEKKFGRS